MPGALTSSAGLLMFLGVVVVVAAIGGRIPAVATALAALVARRLVPDPAVPVVRDRAWLRRGVPRGVRGDRVRRGGRGRAGRPAAGRGAAIADEADVVFALADRLARPNPPQVVVEEIHDTLNRQSVALLVPDGDGWSVEASAGEPSITTPADGEHYELRDGHVLVMTGPPLRADEQRLVAALLSYLEAILAMHRLQGRSEHGRERCRTRTICGTRCSRP